MDDKASRRAARRQLSEDVMLLIAELDDCASAVAPTYIDIAKLAAVMPRVRAMRERLSDWASGVPQARRTARLRPTA